MTHPRERSRIIRGNAGLVWLLLAAVAVAFLLGDVLIRGSAQQAVLIAPWLLLPLWFVWTFLYAPSVVAHPRGATVRNPLRTAEIPWTAVESIALRWQVAFVLESGRAIQAWAIPAGKPTRRGVPHPSERETEILRELHEQAADGAVSNDGAVSDGAASANRTVPVGRVRTSWNAPQLIALVVLVVWAAVAVAVTP
ncbi:PH domain-containing protein [Microbacterium oryzae]|uniref:PH domain-containing protein n=1 Tax=Microbacterium oryzae TaxID=743009 RepID=UPI0025B040F0|nr:PH domain-containing protein [Microbacterium oryzae]MDN3309702.1 PH domain-containing protein [Microbacterium oryzae]